MELLLKIPTEVNIYDYGKMTPWLILKLSQSGSGAVFLDRSKIHPVGTIFPPCGPVAPKQWCAVVTVISLDARERLRTVSVMIIKVKFILSHLARMQFESQDMSPRTGR